MKTQLRKWLWFILQKFEEGDDPYTYKPLNRKILIVVGILFTGLGLGTVYAAISSGAYGYLLPVLVFLAVGIVCLTVGALGSERAVSKIWGNR